MRPWKEWGIDLYLRYKNDVFFSTRAKILLSQTALVIFVVVVTGVFVEYAKKAIETGLIALLSNTLRTGDTSTAAFVEITNDVRQAQFGLFTVLILVAFLVALVTTRLALAPVGEALVTQKRFIESISHELRTSLAVLKTQNEVAKLDSAVQGVIGETLDQNISEIDHINEILNNLLLFNRVGTIDTVIFETVDLRAIMLAVLTRLQRLADRRGVTLHLSDGAIPPVYGNATGLEQLFFNLVKNGVTYSGRDSVVTIACTSITEHDVTVRVSDTGIGIAQEELPHIFKLFYRTDSVQEVTNGTGLGLALVYEIIKLHNGKIHVESTLGVGSRFTVTLPRQPASSVPVAPVHQPGVSYDFTNQNVQR